MSTPKRALGRPEKLSPQQISTLKRKVLNPNPPTQRTLSAQYGVSQSTIGRNIKKLEIKLVKKPKGHHLNDSSVEKRYKRSWPLYRKLRKGRWKKFITSDEAFFYLHGNYGERQVQYISRHEKRSMAQTFSTKTHPKGYMVWIGISANGATKPIFVNAGATINSRYYIDKILKPFAKEAKRLYPDGNYIFQQDSAPAHASKLTVAYLKKMKIPFLRPEQWIPNSPDVAPCDYFLWGYLKSRINKRKIKTERDLKNAI